MPLAVATTPSTSVPTSVPAPTPGIDWGLVTISGAAAGGVVILFLLALRGAGRGASAASRAGRR